MPGVNDRIRLGIIGDSGRRQHLIRIAKAAGGDRIEWVAVCDALDQRSDEVAALMGLQVTRIADYRALIDRKDIDGEIVATLDHLPRE